MDWTRTQLIDIWIPCLAAVETRPTGREDRIDWLEDPSGCWSDALETTTASLVIEIAKLLWKGGTEEFFRPAVRKILRLYLTFHLDSPTFNETVKTQLVIKNHAMDTALDLDHLKPAGQNEQGNILDPEGLWDDPLAIHAREEQEMEAEFLTVNNPVLIQKDSDEEEELVQEHAQEVAKIEPESDFQYANHDIFSLREPVVAAEDESALGRAYVSKGVRGRIRQVRAEVDLERNRLLAHAMSAMKRVKLLEQELKLLDEAEKVREAAEVVALAQLQTAREKERRVKERRAAADAAISITPAEGSSNTIE